MDVAALLRALGVRAHTVQEVPRGWDCRVFDVDGKWMLRVARDAGTAQQVRRECRLLELLADWVSFRVPVPASTGEIGGLPWMLYARIDGRPFAVGDDPGSLGRAVVEIHRVPVAEVAPVLGADRSGGSWRERFEDLAGRAANDVAGLLEPVAATAMAAAFDRLVDGLRYVPAVLVHGDLVPEHVLWDRNRGELAGIVDFGDALIGEAAMDFAGVRWWLGAKMAQRLLAAYGGGVDMERIELYSTIAPVHTVLHGLDTGSDAQVQAGVKALSRALGGGRAPRER